MWDDILDALRDKYSQILDEYSHLHNLDEDLNKDFVGLVKYICKTRPSFKEVTPLHLQDPSSMEPYVLFTNSNTFKQHFQEHHFTPLEACIENANLLGVEPFEFQDVELGNLMEILHQLKHPRQDHSQAALANLETYHGCHCD